MTCPQCASSDTRRSTTSSWRDLLPSLLGRQAFRCRKCRHRFFAVLSTRSASNAPDRPHGKVPFGKLSTQWKKRRLFRGVITAAVIVVMLSLFGLFLHYIAVDHPPKDAEDTSYPSE
jgi:hypothetical protein